MAKKIRDPRLRITRRIKKDQVFKVKVKFDHPSFTGLELLMIKQSRYLAGQFLSPSLETCLSILVINLSADFACHLQ